MKVKELKEKLNKLNDDLDIFFFYPGYDGWFLDTDILMSTDCRVSKYSDGYKIYQDRYYFDDQLFEKLRYEHHDWSDQEIEDYIDGLAGKPYYAALEVE